MIRHRCSGCGALLQSPSCLIGQTETCPECGRDCVVPKAVNRLPIALAAGGILVVGVLLATIFWPRADRTSPKQSAVAQHEKQVAAAQAEVVDALVTLSATIVRAGQTYRAEAPLFRIKFSITNKADQEVRVGPSVGVYLLDAKGKEVGSAGVRLKTDYDGIGAENFCGPDTIVKVSPKGGAGVSWSGVSGGGLTIGSDYVKVTSPFDKVVGWPPVPAGKTADLEILVPVRLGESAPVAAVLIAPTLSGVSGKDSCWQYVLTANGAPGLAAPATTGARRIEMSVESLAAQTRSVRTSERLRGCCLAWLDSLDGHRAADVAVELSTTTSSPRLRKACLQILRRRNINAASTLAGRMLSNGDADQYAKALTALQWNKQQIPLPAGLHLFIKTQADPAMYDLVTRAVGLLDKRGGKDALAALDAIQINKLSVMRKGVRVFTLSGREIPPAEYKKDRVTTLRKKVGEAKAAIARRSK